MNRTENGQRLEKKVLGSPIFAVGKDVLEDITYTVLL